MIANKVCDRSVQGSEYCFVCRDKSRLMAVASRQVLRGDHRNGVARFALHQQDLRVVTWQMNDQSFSVLFVALWSNTKLNSETIPPFSIKKSLRKNSSEMENEVCQTFALPTCDKIHSKTSATCKAFVR